MTDQSNASSASSVPTIAHRQPGVSPPQRDGGARALSSSSQDRVHKLGRDTDAVQLTAKTFLSHLITREFNSPINYVRTPYVRVEP
eukprot:7774483-Pyramimonas_sp.AAC.1